MERRENRLKWISRILFALLLCGCVTADPNAGTHKQDDKAARGEGEKRRMIEERWPLWVSEDRGGPDDGTETERPEAAAASGGTSAVNDAPEQPESTQSRPLELYSRPERGIAESRLDLSGNLDEPEVIQPEGGADGVSAPVSEAKTTVPVSASAADPAQAASRSAASAVAPAAAPAADSRPAVSSPAASAPATRQSAAPLPAANIPSPDGRGQSGPPVSARSDDPPAGQAAWETGVLEYTLPWSADGSPLRLNGLGWIYLGIVSGDPGTVVYQSRSYSATDTIFLFKTAKPGEYRLLFQFQDQKTGIPRDIELSLSLVENGTGTSNPYARGAVPGDYRKAVSLLAEERFKEALYEYMAAFREGDETAASAIGSLAVGTGEYATGASYWKRVMKSSNPQTRARGTIGYTDAVIRGSLADAIPVQDLLDSGRAIPSDLINSAAGFLGSRGELDKAIILYEHLIALYPETVTDKLVFTLARLYETESPRRDERKALAYYRRILETYPLSEYWREAQERSRYIERHYIHIR